MKKFLISFLLCIAMFALVSCAGLDGNGIQSIQKTNTNGLVDTYTIIYTNGETSTFTVTNGKDGINGIDGEPGEDGHTPVITIQNGNWYIDGVDTQVKAEGVKGDTGNGISSISKTATQGLVDTYTITYTDGQTSTFTVTNGKDGINGIDGEPGEDGHTPVITIQNGNWYIDGVDTQVKAEGVKGDTGNGISSISKTATQGLVDTYTITYTDGDTQTFSVTNGKDGQTPTVEINQEGYWVINDEETQFKAEGNAEWLSNMLQYVFDIKYDYFVSDYQTLTNPSWLYTTSTFSGWGGSIGAPEKVGAIAIKIRARTVDITQIKFHLNYDDKNGESIVSELKDILIPAGEEKEVVWILPEEIQNNKRTLYFAYNCNQFCDVYTNVGDSSKVSPNEYQTVLTYSTNGKLLDDASKMVDVAGQPCKYLYAKVGNVLDAFVPKKEIFKTEETINVFLADEYDLAVNDNFQLFYRGVVQAVNPYNYDISVTCSKGSDYPRYFEWKPTENDVGSYKLTLTVRDDNGNILGQDTTMLNVYKPKASEDTKNILCIGDSLTGGGYWVREAQRRFCESGGTPEGLGLDCLNFIGTKTSYLQGKETSHEGHSGWTWASFCGSTSPFYDEEKQDISFKSYCQKNGYEDIDVVYILLTWNGQGTPYKTDFSTDTGHFAYATKLIDKIHEDYPNAVIRCMGIQIPSQQGGMGYNYGATGGYSNDYGELISAMNYNATLEEFCKQKGYCDFVKYIDIAGQFDTDYNMPSTQKPVNNRNNTTETIGTNGVHPTVNGYYQIADAVYRSLCEIFKGKE